MVPAEMADVALPENASVPVMLQAPITSRAPVTCTPLLNDARPVELENAIEVPITAPAAS